MIILQSNKLIQNIHTVFSMMSNSCLCYLLIDFEREITMAFYTYRISMDYWLWRYSLCRSSMLVPTHVLPPTLRVRAHAQVISMCWALSERPAQSWISHPNSWPLYKTSRSPPEMKWCSLVSLRATQCHTSNGNTCETKTVPSFIVLLSLMQFNWFLLLLF